MLVPRRDQVSFLELNRLSYNGKNHHIYQTTNYKIFRKRGLKVYTICICEEKEKEEALEILKRAQLSTLNYFTSANEISEFSKLRDSEGFKTTPFCRVLNGNGKFDYGTNGLIDQKSLKNSFLRVLSKDQRKSQNYYWY